MIDEEVAPSDSAAGVHKRLGTTALKHSWSCHRVTTMKIIPQLPIWLPRWGSCGAVGREATQRDEWRRWEKSIDGGRHVCSLAHIFLERVCLCVQMREHQTHIVTCCVLLNTWPPIKTTVLVSAGAKKPYILHWCISTANLPVYLSLLRHKRHVFLLQTAIACWNSNLAFQRPLLSDWFPPLRDATLRSNIMLVIWNILPASENLLQDSAVQRSYASDSLQK